MKDEKVCNKEDLMKYLFICYPKCSTCKKAKKWLDENNIEHEERNIKENSPTENELREWIFKSKYPIKKFFNTSGNLYKELGLKDKLLDMSEDEKIILLATDGMLVKRPIVICEDDVLVGFKEDEWKSVLV
ncbi:MAG: Regulatory protein MgsR [Tissierella sp.]